MGVLWNRRLLVIVIALVVIGEVCRLEQYLSKQSFWEDEIAVLINVRDHSPRELPFVPLDSYGADSPVAAPPLFLWATQWLGRQFSFSEWAVRLPALICSLAALPLFAILAWRLTNPIAAAWAVALMALSDPLLFQAGNVKPYSGDVLAAVLIAYVGFSNRSAPAARRLFFAALMTAVCQWFSYPSVFVYAALALALWPGFWRTAACSIPAVASFLLVYVFCVRAQRQVNLDVYWIHLFPNFARPWTLPGWFVGSTWELFHFQMFPIGFLMLAAAGVGIWALRKKKDNSLLILLLAPWGLNLFAACLGQFAYGGTRLTLFLAPFLSLLCGIGTTSVQELFSRMAKPALAVLALVPLTMFGFAAYQLVVPRNKGDMRDAVAFLDSHRQPGDEVYLVGNQTIGAAKWYMPVKDVHTHLHLEQKAPIHDPTGRFWLVICYEPRKLSENKPAFQQPGVKIDESRSFHVSGADVLCFVPIQ
jgi:Dolichyl-phosphate-mannose-protein mannosyltransferase